MVLNRAITPSLRGEGYIECGRHGHMKGLSAYGVPSQYGRGGGVEWKKPVTDRRNRDSLPKNR